MTLLETFAGSFVEALTLCCLISLFDSGYGERKWKVVVIVIIVAGVTVITDSLFIPARYFINYLTFILLLSILVKRKLFYVLFEFLISLSMFALLEILFVFVSDRIGIANSLSIADRMTHLGLIFVLCCFIASNKKLQLRLRYDYSKHREEIYLITGTIFLISLMVLYHWDTDQETFFQDLGMVISFMLAWCALNLYLLKKLVDNRRQKELISIHERYLEMTDSLLDGLYAKEHEFKKHLQTILGFTDMEQTDQAITDIREYILEIHKDGKRPEREKSYQTGNSIINALLYSKAKEAETSHITLFYIPSSTPPDYPCQKHELVEIIGNLIDNAFDYVKTLAVEERKVFLSLENRDGKKVIEVRNTYEKKSQEQIPFMAKKGYTTKEGSHRGYGLYNVTAIASRYNGTLKLFYENDQLVVLVLFQ